MTQLEYGLVNKHRQSFDSADEAGPFMTKRSSQDAKTFSRHSSVGASNGMVSDASWSDCMTPSEASWEYVPTGGASPISFSSSQRARIFTPDREFALNSVLSDSGTSLPRSTLSSPTNVPRSDFGGNLSDCSNEDDFPSIQHLSSTTYSTLTSVAIDPSTLTTTTVSSNLEVPLQPDLIGSGGSPPWSPEQSRRATLGPELDVVLFNSSNVQPISCQSETRAHATDHWSSFVNHGSGHPLQTSTSSAYGYQDTEMMISPDTMHQQALPLRNMPREYQYNHHNGQFNMNPYHDPTAFGVDDPLFSNINSFESQPTIAPIRNQIFIEERPYQDSRTRDSPSAVIPDEPRQSTNSAPLTFALTSSSTKASHKVSKSHAAHSRKQPGSGSRVGGRAQGTHLTAEKAQAANQMRKVKVCWPCKLQRDKCVPGDPCERCLKRSTRPNANVGLDCRRDHMKDLAPMFRNGIYTDLHEGDRILGMARLYIAQWGHEEVTIHLTPGLGLPVIKCDVYCFVPNDESLLRQTQWLRDRKTGLMKEVDKHALPLGYKLTAFRDDSKYDKYIEDIIKNHMDVFVGRFYNGENDDFGYRMLKLFQTIKPQKDSDEARVLHDALHLLVSTFILSHTLTLSEDDQKIKAFNLVAAYGKLRGDPGDRYTSPRLTNRQIKWFFSRLHETVMLNQLNKLQQIFSNSRGTNNWTSAFIIVLGLAIAFEDIQKNIHLIIKADADKEFASKFGQTFDYRQQFADSACREIDRQFGFIMQIFKLKYREHNPLKECSDYSSRLGDAGMDIFIRSLFALLKEKKDFLHTRQFVEIEYKNWEQYTARLSGKFLLSFML